MGCSVYGGTGDYSYELELLDNQSKSLQKINGNFNYADDVFISLKFKKNVQIKANNVYTLKLLMKGGQTKAGLEGKDSVTGPDGTTFVFSDSCLSENGTNSRKGQIPRIQYFSEPDEGHPSLQVLFSIFSTYLLQY